jgi:hypothetical protein
LGPLLRRPPPSLPRIDLHAALSDPRRYRRRIQRLHERHLFTPQLHELQQERVSLASVSVHQTTVAKLLARAVNRGEYSLGPARLRTINAGGKERVIFACTLTDLIVHGVVADVIAEALEPAMSEGLYSYRKGVSWWQPITRFAAYVRGHRRSRPDPRTRGLYVLRRDVEAYTDSIPVGPTSPLWPMLQRALSRAGIGGTLRPADWELIETVIRPDIVAEDGGAFTRFCGVPTGQPISCVLFNFYLAGFDRHFDAIPDGFYARYCDDILFTHPDPAVIRRVDSEMRELLTRLALGLNDKKSKTVYLTGAGRRSEEWPELRGTTTVRFLGCRVAAAGTVSLSRGKTRRLLSDLERRAIRTAGALRGADRDTVGRTVCAVINRALQPRPSFAQQASAVLLRKAVTDRAYLQQLDYAIARIVLRAVTGQRSVRAFRAVSYQTIRQDWRLISLLHARNQWGDGASGGPEKPASDRRSAALLATGMDDQ